MQVRLGKPFEAADKSKQGFVNMRPEVTVGDWRHACRETKDFEERTFFLLCRLCGLQPEEMDQLAMPDYQMLVEKIDWGTDPKAPSAS